jgi:hypothetical protein
MKFPKHVLVLATCSILVGVFAGCAWSIGEGKDHVTTNPPTKGQQLIDLKRAADQGAISPQEYATEKQRILSQ